MMDKIWAHSWVGAIIFSMLPLLTGNHNEIIGAGPDVVSTLWGMWWFQQEGVQAALGTQSQLLNYPHGAHGVVLSPLSAVLWSLSEPLVGIARATFLASWIQILLLCIGCGCLAHRSGGCWRSAVWVPLVGTYLFFGIGEGSLVAIACAPMVFGLYCLLELRQGLWRYALGAACCMIWMALENPYLAPFLPVVGGLFFVLRSGVRPQYFLSLMLGGIGILYVAAMFGMSANPDYPREVAGQQVALLGRVWNIVELPWARMQIWEFMWPKAVQWTTDAENATQASGGRYLGLSVFLISLWGCYKHRSARVWLGFALLGICLAAGSMTSGLAFPFLFLNHIMDVIARPLTQPTRYLCFASVGFAMCIAYAFKDAAVKYKCAGLALMFADAFIWGSLRLEIPRTVIPSYDCPASSLSGPTLVWPWDARDGELSQSQLYQLVHEQPAAHTGIASWALPEGKRALDKVRGAGFDTQGNNIRFSQLYRLGYRWIISEKALRGRGANESKCDRVWLYQLRKN